MAMPQFKKTFGLLEDKKATADIVSNVVSTLQAGCFLGALIAFYIADKWGRRPSLLSAASMAIFGIVIQTASSGEIAALYVGRFFAGVGVGAASMLTPLYVSENAPRSIRGGLTGIYQLNVTIGIMMSFWVNYGSLEHSKGDAIWQVPLALQMLPAVFMLVGVSLCNESPRFLAKQDNWEKATHVLTTLRNLPADHPYVRMELEDMQEQLENERRMVGGASFMDLQREMWLIPGNRKRALISIGLMICQQMTGTNAINYYAPQIFKNLGIDGPSTGLFATGIYGVVKVVACAVFLLFVADSLGRRWSLLWTSIAQGACMFIIGIYVLTNPPKEGAAISPFGYVSLVCIFLFAAIFQFGWSRLLDSCLRNPHRSSPCHERRHRRCHPMALQLRRRPSRSPHVGQRRKGRIRNLLHLRLLLLLHVHLRLVPHPGDQGCLPREDGCSLRCRREPKVC